MSDFRVFLHASKSEFPRNRRFYCKMRPIVPHAVMSDFLVFLHVTKSDFLPGRRFDRQMCPVVLHVTKSDFRAFCRCAVSVRRHAAERQGLVETLEAVKPYVENNQYVGLACAMKNAGVGVGIPDTGRCRLVVEDGRLHIFAGASCIGQGLGTVLTQMVYEQTGIPRDRIVYERSNTYCAPDSGTTSGSRQTLFTGEAVRRACQDLKEAMGASGGLDALNGQEFYGEYLGKTDPLGAPVPNPVSHVAYGYATQVCILDDEGKIRQMVAAHDVGKAVNPLSIEGQIEGGVVMSMGFALTERYPLTDCRPTAKYGTLGLFRANQIPEITPIIVEKAGLNVACGAIGIGEITSIPTAPAIADAYYRYDGKFRTSLPLEGTPYSRK